MPRQSNKSNNQTNEDAEVGYKHPPLNSQFRKGQSGNPRGRRKGQRNVAPVVTEILSHYRGDIALTFTTTTRIAGLTFAKLTIERRMLVSDLGVFIGLVIRLI